MAKKSEQPKYGFKELPKGLREGLRKSFGEPFQELNLDPEQRGKMDRKLEDLKKEEEYARNTYRLLEGALAEKNVADLETKIREYGKGEFNFFFSKFVDGVKLFSKAPMIKATGKYLKNIVFDYYAKQYHDSGSEVNVGTPTDEKIPFKDNYLPTYLSFISYWLANTLYIEREFGEVARDDLVKFVTDMAGFYAESGVVFEHAQTKLHRGGNDGVAIQLLRLVDKNKNMLPSLHVEVVAHTYSRVTDILAKHAPGQEEEYKFVKDRLLERGAHILESCLFTKQHGFRDIAAGLAAISARDPNFNEERVRTLINGMFKDNKENLSQEVINEVRYETKKLYNNLMAQIHADPDKDYTLVLIEYIRSIEKETGATKTS